jgi:hypothetical protein
MSHVVSGRPENSEHAVFYGRYIDRVPEDDIVPVLDQQREELRALFGSLSTEQEIFRYEPAKWSVRQVVGHLVDAERIFGIRAFCFSRGEAQSLPGFEENSYVAASTYDRVSLPSLLAELDLTRSSNLAVFRRLDEDAWHRVGTASGHPISVRALAYAIAGHVRHHFQILAERYDIGRVA